MPRVALALTAAGQRSVQTALACGTPLIGMPLQPEQDANVVLAAKTGAARRVRLADAGGPILTGWLGARLPAAAAAPVVSGRRASPD